MDRWHGHVTELTSSTFTARFDDQNYELDVALDTLPAEDRAWLEEAGEGCFVHFIIEDAGDEQTARFEFPKERWTQEEIDEVVRESQRFDAFFAANAPTVTAAPCDVR